MVDQAQLDRIADEVQGHLRLGADMRDALELYTRRLVNQLLVRCNREDIPPKLEALAGELVELMLRADGQLASAVDASPGEVASIKRGDTSITYRDKAAAVNNVEAFLKDYSALLVKFIKPNIPRTVKK